MPVHPGRKIAEAKGYGELVCIGCGARRSMTSEEVEGWWTHGAAQMHKCGDGHVSHSISVEPREVRELRERVDGLERRIEALENPDNLSSLDVRNVGEGSIQKLKEHGIVTKEDARSQEDRVAEIIGRGRATSLMRALSE